MTAPAPTFVLVHSPLVGPSTWSAVADELRRRGHRVVVPHLDNPDDTPGPLFRHHAERVRRAVDAEDRTAPVVLVGHSGAGPVLPAAGDGLVNPVLGYVFVDAPLPRDRLSRLDGAPPEFADRLLRLERDGYVPPWAEWWSEPVLASLIPDEERRDAFAAELSPLPLALFDEPIDVPPSWPDAPCGYVRLSRAYGEDALGAARLGWEVVEFEAGHLHMLAEPGDVATALEDVVETLVGARRGGGERPARATGAVREPPDPNDPVAATRARIAYWVDIGRRVGFLALALAVLLFAIALYWGLPTVLVRLIVASLVIAGVTLLPSLVLGLAVDAAEREEREGGPA